VNLSKISIIIEIYWFRYIHCVELKMKAAWFSNFQYFIVSESLCVPISVSIFVEWRIKKKCIFNNIFRIHITLFKTEIVLFKIKWELFLETRFMIDNFFRYLQCKAKYREFALRVRSQLVGLTYSSKWTTDNENIRLSSS
jgi:hypothetical protein